MVNLRFRHLHHERIPPRGSLYALLRGFLLLLGLLLPLNLPFSIPSIDSDKRFGWSVGVLVSEAGAPRTTIQQVLRHGYTHGVQAGDVVLALDGGPADSAAIARVRREAQVGDTLHLLVERQGRTIALSVPVTGSSVSYASYFWYRLAIALAGWVIGMALIAWRGQHGAALALGAALLLLAPITASAGVPGLGPFLSIARTGWQLQAAAFSHFMPALLLHFAVLQQRKARKGGTPLWGALYLALFIVLLLSTDYLREPMAWSRLGPVRQVRMGIGLAMTLLTAITAALVLRREGARGPDAGRWVVFATLLVSGTNAILYSTLLLKGEQNVGELLWRINGSTLILLPVTGALYLLLPATSNLGERLQYHRRLASAISVLLTAFYGCSVVGAAAVLLSVTGHRLNGGEWLLFSGIFLATVIFSPVLRWSEELADRYIFARWKELEARSQEFTERIGTELTPDGIARRVAEELPSLLCVPHASLALAAEALEAWQLGAGGGIEPLAEGEPSTQVHGVRGGAEDAMRVPIRYPDGTLIGELHLGARLESNSAQFAILGTLAQGIAAALRNAENYLRLRHAEQELADAERIASLGALASGLAHEIKNPLAGLKLGLYLLERDAVEPQKFLRLQRDLRRIDDLVLGLLRFTHDGTAEAHTPVSLHATLDECMADILPLVEDRGVLLQRADVAKEVRVLGAPAPLRLLMSNLLRNALDAAGPGGVIQVRTALSGAEVEFLVQDNGPGIPAKHRERIFELNFSTKPGGSGLGLALARREAERLGGRIEVETAEGEGTLLRVALPRFI